MIEAASRLLEACALLMDFPEYFDQIMGLANQILLDAGSFVEEAKEEVPAETQPTTEESV